MENIVNKIRGFNRFYTRIIGVVNNHILESQYSLSEVRVMYEIYHNPKITARQIKEIIQVDEGYLSRLIKKLVTLNIINKIKSQDDHRISYLKLTENGEKIFLNLNQRSSDAISEIIQHLNKGEQEELILLYKKIEILLTKKGNQNED
ncbi:MarR family winged helix-turn-helix transcriptional regulator [Aquimarina macrocephali]|uniref:MarR family winged helix-turn-helix transcriptional regulator n=1 Tax=Aquimarina macrocephali TaxID=666563 RepID=UPI000464BCD0|nr:MarR family winged helix-turn-helix transcriptional regulator [Aquimarina macrocephali]